jgi:hypothetical protein
MLDGAILARRVHGLKDQQYGPFVLCVEHVLEFGEGGNTGSESFLRAGLLRK